MSITTTLALVGRPVAYFPRLARFFGSTQAAILFSQLHYWQQRTANELGVHKTADELEDETGLSYREQATARKVLRAGGWLQETQQRLQHLTWFKLDLDAVDAAFSAWHEAGGRVVAAPAATEAAAVATEAAPATPEAGGEDGCNSRATEAHFPNDENAVRELRKGRSGTAETAFDSKGIDYLQREENPPTPLAGGNGPEGLKAGAQSPASVQGDGGEAERAEDGGADEDFDPCDAAEPLLTMKAYKAECRALGRKALPDDAPVWEVARKAGIPREFVGLAWLEVVRKGLESGKRGRWMAALRRAVEKPWLWRHDEAADTFVLTTAGITARRQHEELRGVSAARTDAAVTRARLEAEAARWTPEAAEAGRQRARELAERVCGRDGRAAVRVSA